MGARGGGFHAGSFLETKIILSQTFKFPTASSSKFEFITTQAAGFRVRSFLETKTLSQTVVNFQPTGLDLSGRKHTVGEHFFYHTFGKEVKKNCKNCVNHKNSENQAKN